MKTVAVALALCALLAANGANAMTIGDFAAGLCPDAQARLGQNEVLLAVAQSSRDMELGDFPADDVPILVAPSDDAFSTALIDLNLTAEQLLSDPETMQAILGLHIGYAANTSTTMTTVGGSPADFLVDDSATPFIMFNLDADKSRSIANAVSGAAVTEVIQCPAGATVIFVDGVLQPGTAGPAGAPAPGPAPLPSPPPPPAGPINVTVAEFLSSTCPAIQDVLAAEDFSTLVSLINIPEVANTVITVPAGQIVVAAPTNAAFEALLAAIGPEAAANATLVAEILANHIAVSPNVAAVGPAKTLAGENMQFWRMGADGVTPAPVSAAALAADTTFGLISDSDASGAAGVELAVACNLEGQWAFTIDKVLVPSDLTPPPAPAPAPAPAPLPTPSPSPLPVVFSPPPPSGASAAVATAAAAFAAAALLLA